MAETDARRLLAALAGDGAGDRDDSGSVHDDIEYGTIIDRATAATEDVASATAFLADHDLDELEAAVERAERDLSERGAAGRSALQTLRAFRRVAVGQSSSPSPTFDSCDVVDHD